LVLNDFELQNKEQWENAGFTLPGFDRAAVRERTRKEPIWLHLGAGNIFRAYPAVLQQKLLNEGLQDRGIIVAEGYDYEIIDFAYTAYDDLSVSVTLKACGDIEKTVVASIVESVKMDEDGLTRLREVFAAESLQIVSLTITEKGYNLAGGDGALLPGISDDFEAGPTTPKSYMGKLAALCYHRYKNGAAPLALVSMDNCSQNGRLLHEAVRRFAVEWAGNGAADEGFVDYVDDPAMLAFPWSMIDKITPRPDDSVAAMLSDTGLEGCEGKVTAKKTFIAPFVNSEESEYLVIEDAFPNGRPPLEKTGVLITTRETVEKTEKMKVGTCLNPLHTGLAVFGCLLSYTRISDEMKDDVLQKLVRKIADEGLPVVIDPKIISPAEFIHTVINVRFPNPFVPDTPQRIATDTSQKISVRFGETVKSYIHASMDLDELRAIPLVMAGWCRYLMGVDDNGHAFDISPDPMLAELKPLLAGVELGGDIDISKVLYPLFSNASIFGVDLYEAGLSDRVGEYLTSMLKGAGAVRKTLDEVLGM